MSYSISDLEKWLEIAEEAARRSGMFLTQAKEKRKEVQIDSRRDIKLLTDRQSEEIIVNILKSKSSFSILTEESGMIGDEIKDGLIWIVDPLCGSVNFFCGIPLSCISIGLWKDNEPVLGVIYDFNRNELFSGIANKAAWLNKKKIKVSATIKREDAVLCTGFPVSTDFSMEGISKFIKQVQDYKKIRLFGSAALSLAYVAAGRVDAYYESDIMIWDVAAGLAVVKGADGEIQIRPSLKEKTFVVYASNCCLFEQL